MIALFPTTVFISRLFVEQGFEIPAEAN